MVPQSSGGRSLLRTATPSLCSSQRRRGWQGLGRSRIPQRSVAPHVDDPYELSQFLAAQGEAGAYDAAVHELRNGRKRSHWMWFAFQQFDGLGRSSMARKYPISSVAEARAYVSHPVLGARLTECARILTGLDRYTGRDIFGPVDAMKLRSSMTLFVRADSSRQLFRSVLDRYFGGEPDARADRLLRAEGRVSASDRRPSTPAKHLRRSRRCHLQCIRASS